jgi:Transposase DDE domain group 1
MFQYNYEKVLKEFGVEFDRRPIVSQFGGLAPFLAFLNKGQFRRRLAEQFGEQKARSIIQLMIGIIVGAKDMEDVERIGNDDGYIRKYLKQGLVGAVGAIQLGRDFRAFKKSELESFHDFNMSLPILELAREIPQTETLIFDIDATAVEKYGKQEGVEEGYVEKDKILSCYQYLFFRLHNLDTFFYGTIRGGAAHSQNGFTQYLRRFLPLFKSKWRTVWRADSGYFNESAFDVFSENDATFFIKAPMSEPRAGMASTSVELLWKQDSRDKNAEYASRLTNTAQGTVWREVFKRSKKKGKQLELLGIAEYRYDCVATNDLVIDDFGAFEFYNARANIENSIKELKYGYQLGEVVTDSFDANDAITQVTMLAYLLMSHFKRLALPKDLQRMQISTLRWRLFNIPGRMLWSARRQWVRLYNVFTDEKTYAAIFYKIKYLKSWVLCPPAIAVT